MLDPVSCVFGSIATLCILGFIRRFTRDHTVPIDELRAALERNADRRVQLDARHQPDAVRAMCEAGEIEASRV